MEDLSLALGVTGTGGVIFMIGAYLVSKGIKSSCLAAQTQLSLDIRKVDDSKKDEEPTPNNISRAELEEIIVHAIAAHTQRQHQGAVNVSNTSNIVMPTVRQPSQRDIDDMIKEKIIEAKANDEYTRSRSGSEDSRRSHKSSNSKGKEDNFVMLREEL